MTVTGDRVAVMGGGGVYIVDCRGAERHGPGCYSGVVLHAVHEGDRFDLATGETVLAHDDSEKKPIHVAPDYVAGGFIDSPAFDRFISVNVLRCREELMPVDELCGRRYARGIDVYDIGGAARAVVFYYLRGADSRGYRCAHTSFTNIGLRTTVRAIDL
jgi:hypothetical protein